MIREGVELDVDDDENHVLPNDNGDEQKRPLIVEPVPLCNSQQKSPEARPLHASTSMPPALMSKSSAQAGIFSL